MTRGQLLYHLPSVDENKVEVNGEVREPIKGNERWQL